MPKADTTLYCSFCGKTNREVLLLIAGPTVFICDECIDLCTEIVAEKRKSICDKIEQEQLQSTEGQPS